jgi:hypothetical protein
MGRLVGWPGVVAALAALSALGCGNSSGTSDDGAARGAPTAVPFWEEHRPVVSRMDADKAFAYFSGHIERWHNHPAVYADIAGKDLTVTGPAGHQGFGPERADAIEAALEAYQTLLTRCGYVVEPPDAGASPDGGKVVIVPLADILPSPARAIAALGEAEHAVLNRVSAVGPGYGYFSGNRSADRDFPTIYAYRSGTQKLVVIGRDFDETFDLADRARAFAAFRALLAKRGFGAPSPR